VPGNTDDPWNPYIREAAYRFHVPELWIREVMQQESGGRLYDDDGALIASPVGAMGLMQVMPQTYDLLQQRYQLRSDPYEPRDSIMAGTAYIREMYDRYRLDSSRRITLAQTALMRISLMAPHCQMRR
jgi:soluble lytic murein transglycosylase-like protein